jgi:acyl-CoA thioester hydrolase
MIEVKTKILEIKSASIKLIQKIYKDEKEIFRMNITLVFLCQDGRISKIPSNIKEFFKNQR